MEPLNLFVKALDFAARKHRDQRRKDHNSSPYINHPISLVQILVNEAGIDDINAMVAAILHDTIEDTDTTPEEIEQQFGKKIRSIVEEVTDDMSLPRHVRKTRQIEHAQHLSVEAGWVKIADKIANLRDLIHSPPLNWTLERKKDYRLWAQAVVTEIKNPHPKLLAIFQDLIQE